MSDNEKKSPELDEASSAECEKNEKSDGKKLNKKQLIHLFATVGLSAFFCAFYYCSMEISSRSIDLYYFFPAIMFIYMAALAVLVFVYIIYNRGFSRKGITVDMLPPEWSEEKKTEFIESGKTRLEKSKWLLIFIISLLFTFLVEAFVLFVLPMIEGFWR